jgi:hypothetical protein
MSTATTTPTTTRNHVNHDFRSNTMYAEHEALARAQSSARLGEALGAQQRYELTVARKLSRQAEKHAHRFRLGLARRF